MKIEFSDRDLRQCAENEAFAVRTMGKVRSNLYLRRIRALAAAKNFEQLKKYPGNFHELIGNRKGQWACNLDQPNRLITKGAEPDETVIWSNVSEATVLEIVDYH